MEINILPLHRYFVFFEGIYISELVHGTYKQLLTRIFSRTMLVIILVMVEAIRNSDIEGFVNSCQGIVLTDRIYIYIRCSMYFAM
jgi:hypothetical protein